MYYNIFEKEKDYVNLIQSFSNKNNSIIIMLICSKIEKIKCSINE